MKKTIFIACILCFSIHLKAQTTDTNYVKLVESAFEDLKKNNCQPCLMQYEAAFKISQRSILSRLRAALCAFNCKNEAAFMEHLNFAVEKDASAAEGILEEGYPEFDAYRQTDFYTTANGLIVKKLQAAGYDIVLQKELKRIEKDDQDLRKDENEPTTPEGKQQKWAKMHELDSLNLVKIEKIFEKHGYPGKSKVGSKYGEVAFLVVQHSNLPTMKKYYALFEAAMKQGELSKSSFALFVDRYRMWSGETQLYGSQLSSNGDGKFKFHPIEDEPNVNKRRAEMDLGSLEEYAKLFGLEYKLPVKKD